MIVKISMFFWLTKNVCIWIIIYQVFFVYKLEKRNTNIYFENFAEFVTEATSERESGY